VIDIEILFHWPSSRRYSPIAQSLGTDRKRPFASHQTSRGCRHGPDAGSGGVCS
jgi:hypothetical protein